jgi:monoamine oxidase
MTDLTRRTVLGGIAAGSMATLAAEGSAAATLQGALPRRVDVVVVGGGISGLVAARKVARSGRSVLVVEARKRVGGRVLNHELHDGSVIESGGAFVGPTQDHILRLAGELGVPTFREYVAGNSVYVSSTLGRSEYQGTVPPDPTILPDAAVLLQQLNSWAAETSVDAPWTHPRAAEWDAMTLGEYIRRNAVNAEGIGNLIKSWTQPGFGADPDELSLLFVIHYIACSGNEQNVGTFERNSDTVDGAQERRFVGGSQRIPLRLAHRLGDRVALAARVSRIDQGDGHAVVHTSRGRVRCRRVIVAAPPQLVLDIDWYPRLPARRRQLLAHMDMGELMKCDAVYGTPFWRQDGLNGFGLNDSGAVRVSFDNCPRDGDPGVLLAFVGGTTWRQYGTLSRDVRRRKVLEGFAAFFGEKALTPVEYTEHDWTRERWTRGGPVAIMGPNTLTSYGSAIRRPHGRVHWAGTETSTYWTGYMDGAVRAGQRAAAEVLTHL